jgi:hypothetical protein
MAIACMYLKNRPLNETVQSKWIAQIEYSYHDQARGYYFECLPRREQPAQTHTFRVTSITNTIPPLVYARMAFFLF